MMQKINLYYNSYRWLKRIEINVQIVENMDHLPIQTIQFNYVLI
jgi:hypothetical protein